MNAELRRGAGFGVRWWCCGNLYLVKRTMKPGSILCLFSLTAIIGPFSTPAAVDKPVRVDGTPRVSLREAVTLANEFLRTNKIDTSHHQMLEGTLGIYPGGPNYWDLRWSPTNKTAGDGFIDVRIDMDRTVNQIAHAEAISLAIAVPVLAPGTERSTVAFDRNSRFAVILSNTSKEPQRIPTEWNSWGYEALSFEITDKTGRKSVARRVAMDFQKNTLNWWVLQPQESVVLDVFFADPQKWEGFPHLRRYGESATVTLRAVFEFNLNVRKPLPEGLWTGRVVSKPEEVVFHHRIPDKK